MLPLNVIAWQSYNTEHLIIYYNKAEQKQIENIANVLEEKIPALTNLLLTPPLEQTKIYYCTTEAEYIAMTIGLLPEWSGGAAFPSQNKIILKSEALLRGQDNPARIVQHEYIHLLIWELSDEGEINIPLWWNEGMAMRYSMELRTNDAFRLSRAAFLGGLIPLSKLKRHFPYRTDAANLAYAQSYSIIQFIEEEYGQKEGTAKIIKNIQEDKNFEKALLKATNLNLSEFEEKWQEYLQNKYRWLFILNTLPAWFGVSVLFLVAYIVKRHRTKQKLEKWEEEESILF